MFFDYQYENIKFDFEDIIEYKNLIDDLTIKQKDLNIKSGKNVDIKKSFTDEIVKKNFHKENIRLSRTAIKDMYSLLYKMGGIYSKTIVNKKIRKKIEED